MRALPSRATRRSSRPTTCRVRWSAGTRIDPAGVRGRTQCVHDPGPSAATWIDWRDPHLLETLVEALKESGDQSGFRFATPPSIEIAEDPGVASGRVPRRGIAPAIRSLKETQDVAAATPAPVTGIETAALPENAFLIVEGVKEFALREAVINIGRRLDNHLVIEDPRVSRHHAQLRAINGRFVLFDLDSSGGSFVNGQRLSQGILYPGDVISLAGVSLIYGQDTPLPQPAADATAPRRRAGTDRPTDHPSPQPSRTKATVR